MKTNLSPSERVKLDNASAGVFLNISMKKPMIIHSIPRSPIFEKNSIIKPNEVM